MHSLTSSELNNRERKLLKKIAEHKGLRAEVAEPDLKISALTTSNIQLQNDMNIVQLKYEITDLKTQ